MSWSPEASQFCDPRVINFHLDSSYLRQKNSEGDCHILFQTLGFKTALLCLGEKPLVTISLEEKTKIQIKEGQNRLGALAGCVVGLG